MLALTPEEARHALQGRVGYRDSIPPERWVDPSLPAKPPPAKRFVVASISAPPAVYRSEVFGVEPAPPRRSRTCTPCRSPPTRPPRPRRLRRPRVAARAGRRRRDVRRHARVFRAGEKAGVPCCGSRRAARLPWMKIGNPSGSGYALLRYCLVASSNAEIVEFSRTPMSTKRIGRIRLLRLREGADAIDLRDAIPDPNRGCQYRPRYTPWRTGEVTR